LRWLAARCSGAVRRSGRGGRGRRRARGRRASGAGRRGSSRRGRPIPRARLGCDEGDSKEQRRRPRQLLPRRRGHPL